MPPLVACIGGCHIDATAIVTGEVVLGSSNPARVSRRPGGVAANAARTAAAMGIDVVVAGLIGDDAEGRHLREALDREGVRTGGLRVVDASTAVYTAVVDRQGELVLGIADMEIYERFDAGWVADVIEAITDADTWVLDANLSDDAIGALVAVRGSRTLLADPVSVAKAGHLVPFLDGIDIVTPDRGELSVLAGGLDGTPADLVAVVGRRCGVIASLGAEGIITLLDGSMASFAAIPPDRVVDPTGAGDAMVGAYAAGLALGVDPIPLGLAAASLAVEVEGAVHGGLDLAAIVARSRRRS